MSDRKPVLRAVTVDEKPDPVLSESLDAAIASGDPLRVMLAQRREIAGALPDLKGPALAAMHRQLMVATERIEELKAKASGEVVPGVEVDDEEFDADAI